MMLRNATFYEIDVWKYICRCVSPVGDITVAAFSLKVSDQKFLLDCLLIHLVSPHRSSVGTMILIYFTLAINGGKAEA